MLDTASSETGEPRIQCSIIDCGEVKKGEPKIAKKYVEVEKPDEIVKPEITALR